MHRIICCLTAFDARHAYCVYNLWRLILFAKFIGLLTKLSDMARRFEVIMTSFSSDKRNGQV